MMTMSMVKPLTWFGERRAEVPVRPPDRPDRDPVRRPGQHEGVLSITPQGVDTRREYLHQAHPV